MTDLETEIRGILDLYRQRYRQLPIPSADDEAAAAILAACRAEADRAAGRERAGSGKSAAAKPAARRTAARRSAS